MSAICSYPSAFSGLFIWLCKLYIFDYSRDYSFLMYWPSSKIIVAVWAYFYMAVV